MKVEIQAGQTPGSKKLVLDGVDITSAVHGVSIQVSADKRTAVVVDLMPRAMLMFLDADVFKMASGLRTELERNLLEALDECYGALGHEIVNISDKRMKEIRSLLDSAVADSNGR